MSEVVQGIGVSAGTAVGPAFVIAQVAPTERAAGTPAEEQEAYERARAESSQQLAELAADLRARGLEEQTGIMDAQMLMLRDPGWTEMIAHDIAAGASAIEAARNAGEYFAATFEALDDPYMAARAADVRDITGRLIGALAGGLEAPRLARPSVVVARELTPSQTASLDRSFVLGFATDAGSTTSHTAILARALNLPAVVGLSTLSSRVRPGQKIALDGESGTVILDPDEEQRQEHGARAAALSERRVRLRSLSQEPAETRDGHRIILAANIGSPADVPAALEAGAEGVGLFRTEFLFADRLTMPGEEEQVEAYRAVLGAMPEHRVVIRTLDVGGDKPLPYLPQPPEANPFLGQRGIRYTLAHPELMQTQLRALLRASSAGRLSIMLPMVSNLAEIAQTAEMLAEARGEVGGDAELGIMIEVPGAALLSERFARYLSFVSAGTNDLTQYTLAVDRGNETVAPLYQPLHPGLLLLLQAAVSGAHQNGCWAGVCGEMAGDLEAIPILAGLGMDELSMTPGRIPEARERIRSLDLAACRELATRALECETAEEVADLVQTMTPMTTGR